jgi:hypothetical protein
VKTGAIIVASVVVLFAMPAGSTASPPFPPDDPLCKIVKGGWACQFTGREGPDPEELQALLKRYADFKRTCAAQNGRWRCPGFCEYWYPRSCQFLLSDAGKTCSDNAECSGSCVIETRSGFPEQGRATCKQGCQGSCSEYVKQVCDRYYEVRHGKLIPHFEICD